MLFLLLLPYLYLSFMQTYIELCKLKQVEKVREVASRNKKA